MTRKEGLFYAKILLFGEYSIIYNSMALTVPYTHFHGELSFIHEDKYTDQQFASDSNRSLREFSGYLKRLSGKKELITELDLERMEEDISKGLYFESSIPQGFGVGSSGALVAAVYEKYAVKNPTKGGKLKEENLTFLKKALSQMESFFHGVSSGMDPLNCYLGRPLLIKPDTSIVPVKIPGEFPGKGGIFLINTGKSGKTGPLVSYFFEKCRENKFYSLVTGEMIPLTNQSIEAILEGKMTNFFVYLKKLSVFFFENLRLMIPEAFHQVWQEGLVSGEYYLKLCGSGGGGFLLGFTENLEKTRMIMASAGIEIIPVSKLN